MQRPPFLSLLCVLLASFAVSGCATTPHFDRNFGRSVGLLRAQVLRDVVNDKDMDRSGHGIIFRHRNGKMPSCFDMNINIVSILTYITRTAPLPFTCVRHHRARPGWQPSAANRARGRRRPA